MSARMCRKGKHPMEGANLMRIPGTDKHRCRACKNGNEGHVNFVARWPIIDDTIPDGDLIAEATADLPRLCPEGMGLQDKRWRIEGGELVLKAYATPTPRLSRKDRCKRGHLFTDDTTAWRRNIDGRIVRTCRICRKMSQVETLPIAPLMAYLRRHGQGDLIRRLNRSDLARRGRIHLAYADEFVVKELKVHPSMVWGDEWWDQEAMEDAA